LAVGTAWHGDNASTLVERWTPAGVTVVQSPSPGTAAGLNGIEVVSAKNMWAVGYRKASPLVLHWNGKRWAAVSAPGTGVLNAVDALGPANIWAVGGTTTRPVIEHWIGKKWKVVPSPSSGKGKDTLRSVEAVKPNDVWAVGYTFSGSNATTLVEHWNGKKWSIVSSPSPGTTQSFLYGVAAASSRNVWATGNELSPGQPYKTTALHWNGSSWTQVPTPSPSSAYNVLQGAVALKSGLVWVVGDYNAGPEFDTLVLRRCG
jgi:hypothetical protein